MEQTQNIYMILLNVAVVAVVMGIFLYYTRYLLIGKYWDLRNIHRKKIKALNITVLKKLMPKHYLFLVTYENVEYLIMCNEYHSTIISSKSINPNDNAENHHNTHIENSSYTKTTAEPQREEFVKDKAKESVATNPQELNVLQADPTKSDPIKSTDPESTAATSKMHNSSFNTQDSKDPSSRQASNQTFSNDTPTSQTTTTQDTTQESSVREIDPDYESEEEDYFNKHYSISTDDDLEKEQK